MTQDPNYQDQGALDQPQQGTEAEPGAYTTPGVVPPDQQQPAPELPASADQVPGGGAVESDATPETAPAAPAPAASATATATAPTPTPSAPAPSASPTPAAAPASGTGDDA